MTLTQRPTEKIVYLTGVSTRLTEADERDDLGLLVTPRNSIHKKIEHYAVFGADNGCYNELHPTKGFEFDDEKWLAWLDTLPRDKCLFVTLPDVLEWFVDPELEAAGAKNPYYCIGNLEATLERSARYVERVRELGFPVAIVAQDGLGSLDELPFEVDAIFIGGSDDYKLGPLAADLAAEAKARGKFVHVGRVNSYKRLSYSKSIGADSADGTFVGFKPSENYGRMIEWLDKTNG